MKKVYLIAVIFAIIAGFATYMFASEINEKSTIKDADTVKVLVPVNDIEKNTTVTADMYSEDGGQFVMKTILASDSSENYVTDFKQLYDEANNVQMVTVDKLYAGEPININRVQSIDGDDVALSLKLANGKVAYSFSAASVTSVDGYISEGDTVDVLVFTENDKGEKVTENAYKGLKILRVSTNKANSTASTNGTKITDYSTLTVEVTKEQALKLYEIENEYSFKLILNSRD